MPNLYIAPAEIKDTIPDLVQAATTKYDDALMRYAGGASRWIDRYCKRRFYPVSEARVFDGASKPVLWIDDVLSVSQVEYSEDDGKTYTVLAESGNWFLARAEMTTHPGSYDQLVIDPNGTELSAWPKGRRSVRITGIWGYADDRGDAWESSGDTVQDNPLLIGATPLNVVDADGVTAFGVSPRFGAGTLIRAGGASGEYMEATARAANALTVLRGRNGTTAAQHAQATAIDIWRPPDQVKQAAQVLVVRAHMRATQGYADSRANADIGELFFLKKIDPEVVELLAPYRLKVYA